VKETSKFLYVIISLLLVSCASRSADIVIFVEKKDKGTELSSFKAIDEYSFSSGYDRFNYDPIKPYEIPLYNDMDSILYYDSNVYVNPSGLIIFQQPYNKCNFPQPLDKYYFDIDFSWAGIWWKNFISSIE
jgi:hypothetical protein